jgi:hypothetical protein
MEIPEVNPYPSGSAHAAHAVFTTKNLRDKFRIKDCTALYYTRPSRERSYEQGEFCSVFSPSQGVSCRNTLKCAIPKASYFETDRCANFFQLPFERRSIAGAGPAYFAPFDHPYSFAALSCKTIWASSSARSRVISPSCIIPVKAIARASRADCVVCQPISSQLISGVFG